MIPHTPAPDAAGADAERLRKLSLIASAVPRDPGKRRAFLIWSALASVCLAAACLALAALERPRAAPVAAPASPPPPPVRSASTGTAPSAVAFEAQGFVSATRRATVSTLVAGIVTAVPVALGERVDKGQVIGVLDAGYARRSVELAEKQREAGVAALASAEATRAQARLEYEQEIALHDKQFSSGARLNIKKTALDVAGAACDSARAALDILTLQVRQQRVQLSYHTIRAPFAGVVTEQNAQPGELIAPSGAGGGFTRTGICTIVDIATLDVVVDVSEQQIHLVRLGAPVSLRLYAYEEVRIAGTVSRIMPVADRAKGSLQVRIALLGKDERILPDMRVRVSFLAL